MTRTRRRISAVMVISAVLALVITSPAVARTQFPDRIELPDGFLPEGIAIERGGTAYFGSRTDGDIYAADLRTGFGRVISQGPGTPSVGLKVDRRGRLFVAGGPSGTGRVVDSDTGEILRTYPFATAPTFVNDVVLARTGAWFTDSQRAQLYRVPIGRDGALPGATGFTTLPLARRLGPGPRRLQRQRHRDHAGPAGAARRAVRHRLPLPGQHDHRRGPPGRHRGSPAHQR